MSTDLVETAKPLPPGHFDQEQLDLLKRTIAKGTTDLEFQLFIQVCKRRGLDPFTKQIYAVKRWNGDTQTEEMVIQTGIDGFRLQAQRSHEYEGQTKPEWSDHMGKWNEVWLKPGSTPLAARIGVHRKNFREPCYATVHFGEFVQQYRDKRTKELKVVPMWRKMPANQIAKCAEAAALRKAFPEELSGIYIPEEIQQRERDGFDEPAIPATASSEPAPGTSEPSATESTSPYKTMLEHFAEIKKHIGEEIYYRILREHGYEHSNQIPGIQEGRKIYARMTEILRTIIEAKEQAGDVTDDTPDDDDDEFDQPDAV